MMHQKIVVAVCALFLVGPTVHARGPVYSSKSGKSVRSSSYSQKGSPAKPGYSSSSSSKLKYQTTRTPLPSTTKTYQRPSPNPVRTRIPTQPSRPSTSTANKYSTQRPSYSRYPTTRPTVSPQTSKPSTSSHVRFPTRPTYSGSTSSTPTVPTAKPNYTAPYKRPPVVFYPPPSKQVQVSRPTRTPVTLPNRVPTTSPPTKKESYRPPLRPNYPTYGTRPQQPSISIVNQPTTITNNTTNVTNNITNNSTNFTYNKTNVNNWFQQNNWRNRVTINSNNWNGRPWWHKPDYGDWHHGHWHGQSYFQGRNAWTHTDSDQHPWLNGLVSWGLGNLIYRTGYQVYSNPYRVKPLVIGTTTIDYSQPICVQYSAYEKAYAEDEVRAAQLRTQAMSWFARARQSFYEGDSRQAYEEINNAIALMPDDTSLHEFRALLLFSAGRYREAAEVMHAVLAVAPGWDWTTLSGLYRDNTTYSQQLRALEQYTQLQPREAHARFLLAYHYITMGYPDNAEQQLRATLILNPNDQLSADLLSLLQKDQSSDRDLFSTTATPVPLKFLQGDWKARRPDGVIELEFDGENFRWDYDLQSNDQRFRGRSSVTQNLLILATETGSQMVGTLTVIDPNRFTFRLLGSGLNDPGLEFVRQ